MKKKMVGILLIAMSIAGTAMAAASTYPDASKSLVQYAQDDNHHTDKDKCCKDDDAAK